MSTMTGARFTAQQRARIIRELETYRRQGVVIASQILNMVTLSNFEREWPRVAPLYAQLIAAQQMAGRNTMAVYLSTLALGTGAGLHGIAVPVEAEQRNLRLPSGLPVQNLLGSAPSAILHRIENGMPADLAMQMTKAHLMEAVSDAVHDEFRKAAVDVLKADTNDLDWAARDAEWEQWLKEHRSAEFDAETRRARRNTSHTQRMRQGIGDVMPGVQRYIRVPSVGACSFCLMLATKGAVYYRDSFTHSRDNHRGPRPFRVDGNATVHAHCRCTLFPVPSNKAFRNVVVGDSDAYAAAIWSHKKTGRKYELGRIMAQKTFLSREDFFANL